MTEKRYQYYFRDGTGTNDTLAWAKAFEKGDRHVGWINLSNGYIISTVWLGLNHAYGDGPPLIYETMVFRRIPRRLQKSGPNMSSVLRQSTEYLQAAKEKRMPRTLPVVMTQGKEIKRVHYSEQDMERYSTEAEALAGHWAMVEKWRSRAPYRWTSDSWKS